MICRILVVLVLVGFQTVSVEASALNTLKTLVDWVQNGHGYVSQLASGSIFTNEDWSDFDHFISQVQRVYRMKNGVTEPIEDTKRNIDTIQDSSQSDQPNHPFEAEKRGISSIDCGPGKVYSGQTYVDKCVGKNCSIDKIVCGNTTFNYGEIDNLPVESIKDCTVAQLVCYNKRATTKYSLDNYNQNTNTTCRVNKFLCAGVSVKPEDITLNSVFTCETEVLCGNRVFGWDAYDFECYTDELYCNGSLVDDPSLTPVSDDCEIRKKPCSEFGHSSSQVCHNITKSCYRAVTPNLCSTNVVDHQVQCQPHHLDNCSPHKIQCGGTVYESSKYNGSLALCETILSVNCSVSGIIELPSQGSFCRIAELYCDGEAVAYTTQSNVTSHCSISKVWCVNVNDIFNCSSHLFGCKLNNDTCYYYDKEISCRDECNQLTATDMCSCPVDYTGSRCEKLQPMVCNFTVVRPTPSCIESKIFAPKICVNASKDERLTLSYKLSCGFSSSVNYNRATTRLDGFTYSIITDQIALTDNPTDWSIHLKVFNFDQLSDDTQIQNTTLKPGHFLGDLLVGFTLDIPNLNENYYPGGVIYTEYRLHNVAKRKESRVAHLVLGQELIKLNEYSAGQASNKLNAYWVTFGVIAA
eukprot:TRINITY_DN5703_c0_g1_i2.p1 TRINITY_DN5703_c0_g1~~TRINITY_DN5703_c0_g1_i2.p1  ORF type:complete len:637 (-),score=83.15 TRINITY_DN5703_c0_g1_i2:156-2066(-)